ncbi:hypothetical protein SAMN02745121_04772 [Nannocystis exedens]|uniref:Uncharacterized protein n=1 Tax=Nannocystis exedens TaxID=54 RepID=A0A1I2BTT5_9BACT|nr:hypothetical protein [Nannocystis exedens]PCC71266.1 hypothetical protein NAEX_04340 [Nannocystis exedens]SFE59338.1 hypothetical protein SAMN02745121_04772 [Nannocystis exedens]
MHPAYVDVSLAVGTLAADDVLRRLWPAELAALLSMASDLRVRPFPGTLARP